MRSRTWTTIIVGAYSTPPSAVGQTRSPAGSASPRRLCCTDRKRDAERKASECDRIDNPADAAHMLARTGERRIGGAGRQPPAPEREAADDQQNSGDTEDEWLVLAEPNELRYGRHETGERRSGANSHERRGQDATHQRRGTCEECAKREAGCPARIRTG
jgi:hypothetical protein